MPCLLLLLSAMVSHGCGEEPTADHAPSAAQTLRALESIEHLLDAGKNAEALRAAESLQRAQPLDALTAEMLARARMAAHCEPALVADAYARAAELAPASPGLASVAGITAAAAQRWPEALQYQLHAAQLQPGNPQHALQLAAAYRALGQPHDALLASQRAVALAPLDASVQLSLAQSLVALDAFPHARAAALRAFTSNPRDAALRVAVANVLREAQGATEAINMIQLDAARTDAAPAAIESLARAQESAGLPALAAENWQRLAGAPLASSQPCLEAARCLVLDSQHDAAREWLARARERGASSASIAMIEKLLPALPSPK